MAVVGFLIINHVESLVPYTKEPTANRSINSSLKETNACAGSFSGVEASQTNALLS